MIGVEADRFRGAAERLLVLLPGAYMQPADFVAAGFISAVRNRGLPWDIALAGYDIVDIAEGPALQHLHHAVVAPSHLPVTLAGISLGGRLATTHADRYPDGAVDALCLLAPYPGPRPVTDRVLAAATLADWESGAGAMNDALDGTADDDIDRRAWRWWQRAAVSAPSERVFLGWGADDRFAASHRRMAEALPAGAACERAGAHDWPTWSALWHAWLEA